MRDPYFPYDTLPGVISDKVETYIKMSRARQKPQQMSSTELQQKLSSAKTKSDAIDAFAIWASQHGAFSDIDRKLWDKLESWRCSRTKQSAS